MALKLAAVITCTFLLLSLALINQQESVPWAERNSIREVARKSKAEGKKNVTLPGRIVNYAGRNMEFATATKLYSVVIAEPIETKSYLANGDDIHTWYKFRLLETLSAKPNVPCVTCPLMPEVPSEAEPLGTDEFVVISSGGSLNIEGVDITLRNHDLFSFVNGQKYLLFISFTPSRVARIGGGPSGVFRINGDGDLEAVGDSKRPIAAELKRRFGWKLSTLKSHFRFNPLASGEQYGMHYFEMHRLHFNTRCVRNGFDFCNSGFSRVSKMLLQ